MRRLFPKWLLSTFAAVLASASLVYAVNISGTFSETEYSIVKVGYIRNSQTDTITAFAGGGQASAVLLDSSYNRVTTVATAADSVKLPTCQAGASNTGGLSNTIGMMVWVTNAAAANSMNVFPQSGQAINALANDAAYAMAANKTAGFICGTAGKWYSVLGG